jgi:SAM-dependent methyltransferase
VLNVAEKRAKKKSKPSLQDQAVVRQLLEATTQREPYADLARRIVQSALERYLPGEGPIVEIGAGTGQLRQWLEPSWHGRLVHTEPVRLAIAQFERRHPGARVQRASAEALPFAADELSGIIGLCVLDVVSDGAAIAREAARVLEPGAYFVHFLDLSTDVLAVVERLADMNMVPLPNVFSDSYVADWPEDVFVAPRGELEQILALLRLHEHPFARPLGQYLALVQASPLPARRIAAEYRQLSSTTEHRRMLRELFRTAYSLAGPDQRAMFTEYRGSAFSSAQHLATRLSGWFNEESGFRVIECAIRREAMVVPGGAPRYRSLAVGEARLSEELPDVRLVPDGLTPGVGEALLELGIFAFAAQKI